MVGALMVLKQRCGDTYLKISLFTNLASSFILSQTAIELLLIELKFHTINL